MDAKEVQIGHVVQPIGTFRYGTVLAIQRRRFRAEIVYPDGQRRWWPVARLRRVEVDE